MSSANILFIFVMLIGPLITLTSSSWILAWVGVELAFISLIPIMVMGKYFSSNKEACMKYFCIQALSSAFLFMSGMTMFLDYEMLLELIFIISLCLKLGLFPGHFWVPSVISSLDWFPCLILLTWQKVAPLALLVLYINLGSSSSISYLVLLGGMSALVGGLIGNNMNNIRAMIGASSISHMGWVMLGSACGSLWLYFGMYCSVLSLSLALLWNYHPVSSFSILSLSGLPPFLMFVGKWSIISSVIYSNINVMFLGLPILGTLLSLVFYLKYFYSLYLNSSEPSISWMKSVMSLSFINFVGLLFLVFFFGDRS